MTGARVRRYGLKKKAVNFGKGTRKAKDDSEEPHIRRCINLGTTIISYQNMGIQHVSTSQFPV